MSISWFMTCHLYFPGALCNVCCVNINDLLLLRERGQMISDGWWEVSTASEWR